MTLHQPILALPGDTLADVYHGLADQAAGNLLATWTALWDPAIVSHGRTIPVAKSLADIRGQDCSPSEIIVVPAIASDGDAVAEPDVICTDRFVRRAEVIAHLADVLGLDQPLGSTVAADFYALGFAYLQIEILTRSMHYDSHGTTDSFRDAVVAAADAALVGNIGVLDEQLDAAYDQLLQSRNHYYPIDFYLIDFMLTVPSVAGAPLAHACRESRATNLLATGATLRHMAEHHPDSLAAVREAWDAGRLTVCGGSQTDLPLAEWTPEGLLADLRAGGQAFKDLLGRGPTVFAHHAGPMTPLLPGVLYKLGYHAAVLADFCGGKMPSRIGSRATWTGFDNAQLEALAAEPIDVGSNSAMLALAKRVQHTMNYDLAASLLLVGWPGHRTEWHADLIRVTERSTILGRAVTLDEYIDITSSHDDAGASQADIFPAAAELREVEHGDDRLAALAIIAGAEDPTIESLVDQLVDTAGEPNAGTLWLNAATPFGVDVDGHVPAFGWRWQATLSGDDRPPRCEAGRLLNEHLEVVFDPTTGGISATRLHTARGNHLSQQLVVEPLGPQAIAAGLQLAFDGWQVVESSETAGALQSDYRLVDRNGKTLSKVWQVSTLRWQSKSIDVRIEVEPPAERAPSYRIASRIAVRDEDFALTRGLQGVDLPTRKSTVTAAWLGIGCEPVPLALLCDSPRTHRRHSHRLLDTWLVETAGENRRVGLSYVVDCRYPAQAFATWRHPEWTSALASPAVRQPTGWWLHLGANNLQVTYLAAESMDDDLVVRMRLLETAGRPVTTQLAAWQAIVDARQLNFLGEADQLLAVSDGKVQLSFAAYEFAEVEFVIPGRKSASAT